LKNRWLRLNLKTNIEFADKKVVCCCL